MKLIIAGSREYQNFAGLLRILTMCGLYDEVTEVVSGGCRGVDMLGERWAKLKGLPVKRFPADWEKHGRAAGPIRNTAMAKYADALLAIKPRWRASRGTEDMIRRARENGLQVVVFLYPQPTEQRADGGGGHG